MGAGPPFRTTNAQFRIREWQARNRRVSYTQMAKELHYRLIKELWAFTGNRIAGRFAYENRSDVLGTRGSKSLIKAACQRSI